MNMLRSKPLLALAIAVAAGCVVERGVPPQMRPVSVEHGRVVVAELVERPSAAQHGAVVGGLLGFMLSGRSAPEKILGTFWGAAAGSAVAEQSAGPRQAWAYTVQLRDGRTERVLTERPDLRQGDCVAIESARYVNLRRVSDAFCQAPSAAGTLPEPDAAIEERVKSDASSCEDAKGLLEGAKSREETEAAVHRVRALCDM